MVTYSKFIRILFIILSQYTMLKISVTRAEEASILAAATVIHSSDISSYCPDPSVLINGFYNTYCKASSGIEIREFVIDF